MISYRDKTILVTGCNGFLGSHLVTQLAADGAKIIGVDRSGAAHAKSGVTFIRAKCEDVFEDLIGRWRPDFVFHLAGPASVNASLSDPKLDFKGLLPGVAALGSALLQEKLDARVVLFSSAAVYGEPESLPVDETAPIKPISPYGIHKAAAENLLGHYGRLGGFPVASLRIFSAYGIGLRRQLFWDLGQRAVRAQKAGQTSVEVFGTGNETRDFIHAKDVARAAAAIARSELDSGLTILNVASGSETRIEDAAKALVSTIDPGLKITFTDQRRSGDPSRWVADVRKLDAIGFRPTHNLFTEIDDLARWIAQAT